MRLCQIRIVVCLTAIGTARAQLGVPADTSPGPSAAQLPLSGRTTANGAVTAVQNPAPGATATVNTLNPVLEVQGAYAGSVPQGVATGEVLPLTLREAIRRGIEFNLGSMGFSNAVRQARGQAIVSRSALLPNIHGNLRETLQKINLAALGVRSPLIPPVVGPFNYFDLRATLTQALFDLTSLNNYRASKETAAAAEYLMADARDAIVLAVVGAYLQAVAAQSRVDAARAQLETARALFEQAEQQSREGLIARVDANRSRVEMQTQEQRLITLENDLAKQKLNLARMIGLPPGQQFMISDPMPESTVPPPTFDEALRRAFESRGDLRAAEAQLRAAERIRAAARAERFPTLSFSADYGAIGTNPSRAGSTYTVTGNLRIPIWQGGRAAGSIDQASAALEQRRAELADIRARIDQEIRTAFLDLESAANQIRVAESNRDVARQNLDLTRQRFEAGVADTAELVQAQETLATAEHDLITSAFSHGLAKAELARAMGRAEETIVQMLGIK